MPALLLIGVQNKNNTNEVCEAMFVPTTYLASLLATAAIYGVLLFSMWYSTWSFSNLFNQSLANSFIG
jgi:hypothetical protein